MCVIFICTNITTEYRKTVWLAFAQAFVLEAKARDDPLTVRKKVQIPNWSRIVRAWRDVLWSKFPNP